MEPNSTSLPGQGVLPINKPAGITSHDVVATVRSVLRDYQQHQGLPVPIKVGHTGTLDPFATGLLLIVLGSSTRLVEYAHAAPKTYETTIVLGATSSTDDGTGVITATPVTAAPTRQAVERIIAQFIGTIKQLPPWYSAVKMDGKKLYEYARGGALAASATITRQPRTVHIEAIEIISYDYPQLSLRVRCGSGTYIRALGRDIGERLATGGYVEQLRRTEIGVVTIDQAAALNQVTPESWHTFVLPPAILVNHLPPVTLTPENVAQLRQGRGVQLTNKAPATNPVALIDQSGQLFGVGWYEAASQRLLPRKIL